MNKLFLYYSFTGNGDFLAEEMKKKGYDTYKIIPKHNLPKSLFCQMMLGGMLAGLRHKAKLKDYNPDLSKYDEIILGSPIWNGKLACPINTVLKKTSFEGKMLTILLYAGGGSASKTKERLEKDFNATVIEFKEPKKYKDDAIKKLSKL